MAKRKKSYLNLLEETVNFYSEDLSRRSLNDNSCVYLSEVGNMCAVGRCMTKKHVKKAGELNQDVHGIYKALGGNSIDDFLQVKYRGYNIKMWLDLQRLHDDKENWDTKGLTDSGRRSIKIIRMKINKY
jgi:hypothetical protein